MKTTLHRMRRGYYATDDHRFVLERAAGEGWKLLECGRLRGYKPRVYRTSRTGGNTARHALKWAHAVIRGEILAGKGTP